MKIDSTFADTSNPSLHLVIVEALVTSPKARSTELLFVRRRCFVVSVRAVTWQRHCPNVLVASIMLTDHELHREDSEKEDWMTKYDRKPRQPRRSKKDARMTHSIQINDFRACRLRHHEISSEYSNKEMTIRAVSSYSRGISRNSPLGMLPQARGTKRHREVEKELKARCSTRGQSHTY